MRRIIVLILAILSVTASFADFNSDLEKAKQGDAEAQNNLGICYKNGKGVTQDYTQAVYWFRKSAEQGYADAQNNLGNRYYNGEGVPQDYTQAVYWFRKSADQGEATAQYNLGICYKNGKGVTQDYTQAVYWYRRAAEQGYADAQNNLGYCYGHGQGVTQDYNKAVYWYRKSAEQGNAWAQNNLGICYANGQGVEKNEELAKYWTNLNGAIPTIQNSVNPPLLTLINNSLQLIEQNTNNTIDANEQCKIQFKVTNKGKGPAIGCKVKIKSTGSTAGLTIGNATIPTIAVNATQTIEIPVTASINTTEGIATFTIEVTEPNGYGIDPMTLTVNTRAFDAPLLKVVDYAISGNGTIQKKQPFDLQILLQNTKYGKAENVDVTINLPTGITLWDGQEQTHYASISGGEQQRISYQLAISGNYMGTSVPVQINIKEKYGRFAENKTINLTLNQQLTSSTSVTLQGERQQEKRDEIAIGALGSAVDKNIPTTKTTNQNTFAFIIANENYEQVASVPMALNDGSIFKTYCQKTLGLPADNIKYYPNATLGKMVTAVETAKQIANAYRGDVDIIFYYAGHGIPDERTKSAYLLPVDANGSMTSLCYSVDQLYQDLGSTKANRIVIFLDACFSGSERGDKMLASARGIAIKTKSGVPQGNMVVLSAATGDQTAYPLESEGHGMFTYFLLEKLQQTNGDVTILDLFNYIRDNVERKSSVTIKPQTPTIILSPSIGADWQSWKLR